jgi:cell shape-determining protein MreC
MSEEIKKLLADKKEIFSQSISYDYDEITHLKKEADHKIEILDSLEDVMRDNDELRSILVKINNISKKKG